MALAEQEAGAETAQDPIEEARRVAEQYWACVRTNDTESVLSLVSSKALRHPRGAFGVLGWEISREKHRKYDALHVFERGEFVEEGAGILLHFTSHQGSILDPSPAGAPLAVPSLGPNPNIRGQPEIAMLLLKEHRGDWKSQWTIARISQ